jgi:hypothetical protein
VVAVIALSACVLSAPIAATTEPEETVFDRITLTNQRVVLSHAQVDVSALVVFTVRNASSHPRRIVVGSYRSAVLPAGKQIEFELSFPVPWTFEIRSTGKHVPTLTARFVCSF